MKVKVFIENPVRDYANITSQKQAERYVARGRAKFVPPPRNFDLAIRFTTVLQIVIIGYMLWAEFEIAQLRTSSREVQLAQRNTIVETELLNSLIEAENGERGYILTKRQENLRRFYNGLENAKTNLDLLEELLTSPSDMVTMDRLKRAVYAKLIDMEATVQREALSRSPDGGNPISDNDVNLMLNIRDMLDQLRAKERARRSKAIFGN